MNALEKFLGLIGISSERYGKMSEAEQTKISDMAQRLESAENKASDLEARLSDADGKISALETIIEEKEAIILSNESKHKEFNDSLMAQNEQLETKIQELETKIANLPAAEPSASTVDADPAPSSNKGIRSWEQILHN
jgi:TolA-binding protein